MATGYGASAVISIQTLFSALYENGVRFAYDYHMTSIHELIQTIPLDSGAMEMSSSMSVVVRVSRVMIIGTSAV